MPLGDGQERTHGAFNLGRGCRHDRTSSPALVRAVEGLNLALLVATEYEGVLGRFMYRPTTSSDLSSKRRSRESLKVRLR